MLIIHVVIVLLRVLSVVRVLIVWIVRLGIILLGLYVSCVRITVQLVLLLLYVLLVQ